MKLEILDKALAKQFFERLLNLIEQPDTQYELKIIKLGAIHEAIYKELTKNKLSERDTLFDRIEYIKNNYCIDELIINGAHAIRKTINDMRHFGKEFEKYYYETFIKTVMDCIFFYSSLDIPEELRKAYVKIISDSEDIIKYKTPASPTPIIPGPQKPEPKKRKKPKKTTPVKREAVEAEDKIKDERTYDISRNGIKLFPRSCTYDEVIEKIFNGEIKRDFNVFEIGSNITPPGPEIGTVFEVTFNEYERYQEELQQNLTAEEKNKDERTYDISRNGLNLFPRSCTYNEVIERIYNGEIKRDDNIFEVNSNIAPPGPEIDTIFEDIFNEYERYQEELQQKLIAEEKRKEELQKKIDDDQRLWEEKQNQEIAEKARLDSIAEAKRIQAAKKQKKLDDIAEAKRRQEEEDRRKAIEIKNAIAEKKRKRKKIIIIAIIAVLLFIGFTTGIIWPILKIIKIIGIIGIVIGIIFLIWVFSL